MLKVIKFNIVKNKKESFYSKELLEECIGCAIDSADIIESKQSKSEVQISNR